MKKIFFLSFLLVLTATQCMQRTSLKQKIAKLNRSLYENQHWLYHHGNNDPIRYLAMGRYPDRVYGYEENNGAGKYYKGSLCKHSSKTLAKMISLKNARYKGYSAIGAVTLANTISYKQQKQIIGKLLKAGFIPTKKDKKLIRYLEQQTKSNHAHRRSDLRD